MSDDPMGKVRGGKWEKGGGSGVQPIPRSGLLMAWRSSTVFRIFFFCFFHFQREGASRRKR